MTTLSFDAHAFVKRLVAAGFSEKQAEAQVEALVEMVSDQIATKRDLKELEYRLTLRLGGLVVAGVGVLATMIGVVIALVQLR